MWEIRTSGSMSGDWNGVMAGSEAPATGESSREQLPPHAYRAAHDRYRLLDNHRTGLPDGPRLPKQNLS